MAGKGSNKKLTLVDKQKDLPGMEDRKIPALHAMALKYVHVRDQRTALTPKETEAKKDLLAEMKRNKKEKYSCDGVTIDIVHEAETVKVSIEKK